MPRPRLAMNTKTYNLLMPLEDWQKLAKLAHAKSLELGVYISCLLYTSDAADE